METFHGSAEAALALGEALASGAVPGSSAMAFVSQTQVNETTVQRQKSANFTAGSLACRVLRARVD